MISAPLPSPLTAPRVRLAYLVSHPIQYQAPLLRRIAQQPDIDLTVFFGSDFSVRSYKDEGFGVELAWDTPLTEGYKHVFLKPLRDTGTVSSTSPISRGIYRNLRGPDNLPAFDALWVHGYASVNALQGILAANALGIPVLLRAESWLRDRERSTLKLAAKHLFFKILSRMISATLPIGTFNSVYWQHYFGPNVPQFLMPYAVDNAYFARKAAEAIPHEADLRASLHLEPNRPVILFASKLQERKNCIHLVEAYAQFLRSKPSPAPYLVIVGDGEERARLEAFCSASALTDVRFAGFQNQSVLPRFFQLADVFVLPSRHEPWGLIVNEAMAAGCPSIVSEDVGSHPDLIVNGENGLVFPTGNVPALTAALANIFATPDTAAAMGQRATQRMNTWSFDQDIAGLRAALAHITRKLSFH
ncbi:MAG: glycosyltransferase family 4 protein [Acidobacteriaceae bacterium]